MFPTETLVIWYFTSLSGIHSWGELFDLLKVPFGKDPSLVSTLWSTSLGTFRFLCLLSQTFCCLPWMHWTYGVLGPRSFSLLMTWNANVCTQFAMAWSFKKKKILQSIKKHLLSKETPGFKRNSNNGKMIFEKIHSRKNRFWRRFLWYYDTCGMVSLPDSMPSCISTSHAYSKVSQSGGLSRLENIAWPRSWSPDKLRWPWDRLWFTLPRC